MRSSLVKGKNMKVSRKTINFLTDMITGKDGGDDSFSEYKTGPQLVRFFNDLGFDDSYGQGFPSRWSYAEERLLQLDGENKTKKVIQSYLAPINFIEKENLLDDLTTKINQYLEFDGYKIKIESKTVKVISLDTGQIIVDKTPKIDNKFVRENIGKCDMKISENDFSGAITNARSLLEDVLIHIKQEVDGIEFKYDGDLPKLYKNVSKKLNLHPEDKMDKSLKQILSGLFSIIHGIAGFSNYAGDRHGKAKQSHRTEKHHAILVVNSSKTTSEFLINSFEKQYKKI